MQILAHALLLSPLLAASAPTAPQQDAASPSQGELEGAVDQALRWLRTQQDAETGAYGNVYTTALVVDAFADSHRAYRVEDGPFVGRAVDWLLAQQGADGSFVTPGGRASGKNTHTRAAVRALEHLGVAEEARARALAYLGVDVLLDPADRLTPEKLREDQETRLRMAASLLEQKNLDGTWGDARRRSEIEVLQQTATNVLRLNDAARILASRASGAPPPAAAKETTPLPAIPGDGAEHAGAALERGADFLLSRALAQGRWGFGDDPDPGLTAMVTGALLGVPKRSERVAAAIDAALTYLVSFQRPDGSIHDGQVANYVTSAAVMALARAGRPGDAAVVARAREYLRTLQADESEGYSPGDLFYGGVGYGSSERPDLSNTQMALEALAASGVETGDETFRKALAFLQRCQNRSESSDLALVRDGVSYVPGNDGGGTYAPADSKAGFVELSDGRKVARSYGSMTYALLKGFLLAGLPRDDPRVEAAWRWLRENWTLDVNPGFEAQSDPTAAYQGLFYYYLTMAKALDLYGAEQVRDAAGDAHAWRQELCGRLVSLQRQDGSWQNANSPRWFEGNPVLATSYALLTLDTACPPGDAAKD